MRQRLPIWLAIIGSILSLLILFPVYAQDDDPITPTGGANWDLRNNEREGIFTFYDAPAGASTTGKPLDLGDFDGNGCGDLAVTGHNATFARPDGFRTNAGQVRIVMNICDINGQIAMETGQPTGYQVITLYGAFAGDMAGTETYIADFNNDGYDDLLFSAQNFDAANQFRTNAGAVYLLPGSPDFATLEDIELRSLPEFMLMFFGAAEGDRFGVWVEGGDFDGDGIHDILIGANQTDGIENRRSNAGEAWILYGAEDLLAKYSQSVDMATPPRDATRIMGADFDDLLGSTVWGDDLNDDGYAEAIVSAGIWRGSAGIEGLSFGGGDGPGNTRYNSGETYVIFGGPNLRGQTIDLATRIDGSGKPVDKTVTAIYGRRENDLLGEEIAAGDMDGDGRNDLLLGALIGDGLRGDLEDAGETWIIYTYEPFAGQMIDLANPEPDRSIVIYPDQPNSKGGDTIRVADFNGDGIGDLLNAAPDYDPMGTDLIPRRNTGILMMIFGVEGPLPSDFGRITLPSEQPEDLQVRYIIGADENDMMAYGLAAYDVDGDGVMDIIPNGMGGDGIENTLANAGEIYIISGAAFLADDVIVPVAATTPIPTVIPTTTADVEPVTATIDLSVPGDVGQGFANYQAVCAGCHGPSGSGEGVGLPLLISPLVVDNPDEELLRFLQVGRTADDPENTTGVIMPGYGGQSTWGDQELWDVIAYLRWLIARQ